MADVEIADDDELYRRLAPDHLNPDQTIVRRNAFRVNTGYPRQISVDLKRLTTSPIDTLRSRPTFGLGVLRVADVRALGFTVRHDPLPDNPAHCLIEGDNSRETADKLAQITTVLIPPRDRPHRPAVPVKQDAGDDEDGGGAEREEVMA